MSAGALEQVFANPLAANPNLFQQSLSNVTALRNFQAQQAQANAYRQAINPQTGALDTGRYNALLAATPQGAWGMGPAMQQAGQAQEAQGRGTSADLSAHMQQMNALSGLMTPLLLKGERYDSSKPISADNQPVTADDLNGVVQSAQNGGLINQGEADWARSQIGRPGVNPIDLARGWWFMNQSAREQLAATTPAGGTSRSNRFVNAPRALNEPAHCNCSSLSVPVGRAVADSSSSLRSTAMTGVRRI